MLPLPAAIFYHCKTVTMIGTAARSIIPNQEPVKDLHTYI